MAVPSSRGWLGPTAAYLLAAGVFPAAGWSTEPSVETAARLSADFLQTVRPFLETHCLDCHGDEQPEAQLDLSRYSSLERVSGSHSTWEVVLARLAANEMPPPEAASQPQSSERDAAVRWIRALREYDGNRTAGDPGPVLARRLSNAEYNYSIRDLTGVDMRPTREFPVDPANEAGFDNSGESLTISPALLSKYLNAARSVANHLVLTPTNLTFAPHEVVTETDRDKYCVKRIVEFYQRQPTDLADYFRVCWENAQAVRGQPTESLESLQSLAEQAGVSPKYTARVWELLSDDPAAGPIAELQGQFRALLAVADAEDVRRGCEGLREYVLELRAALSPKFPNLRVAGIHKGSQPFVLWKNRQYAAHRRKFAAAALFESGGEVPDGTPQELILPAEAAARGLHLASIELFCSVFPDAFFVSERGRDYLDVPREKQEKGRLLSAGFHSMMGYFRDDSPLYELILDEDARATLDRLWQELDYVAAAPSRQYAGFLWFERTDSRFMRDAAFDFARAEDKQASSAAMIGKLADVYLEKARRNGGQGTPIEAIENYFEEMNAQIRWVESQRLQAEPLHLRLLNDFARRAWRRSLSRQEANELLAFYERLRNEDRLDHENAMRDSIVSILMSPHFLFRMDLAGAGTGIRQLTEFELASRLSYFLWSTLPDDELLQQVQKTGRPLTERAAVAAQARRMLADDRVRGLASEFAANWLDIRRFEEHNSVDRERYPEFDAPLRTAMFEEPLRYFMFLAQNNRSVLELLDGDYTFVNAVLADHYGFDSVPFAGDEWRRVEKVGGFGRGGLLPMAVFLTKNAPGLRTSPVKRGYWVARRLLGERIPPPPPNVPELPADESQLGELSLRALLARHRDHKSCAGCHDRFDSIGLAFEGYGPIGRRREVDLGGHPVETWTAFPGGEEGSGVDGLRRYLRNHRQEEFLDNLCRKMLSYALGRSLQLSDEPLLSSIRQRLENDGYKIGSLVESIVTSDPFLKKRGSEQLVEGTFE